MSLKVEPEYLKKNLKWLTVLGIDVKPIKNVWYERIYRIYSWTLLIYIYQYNILETIDIIQSPDFNSMTFGLSYFVTHILGVAKITILLMKKDTLRQMLLKLESGYFVPNIERGGEEEVRLVKAAIRRTNFHTDLFNTMVYLIIGIRCLYAILDKGVDMEHVDEVLNATIHTHIRTLPYKAWFPVDLNKSPAFEIMFFVQTSCLLLYGFYISFIDSMIYGMMIHMNTQFKMLKNLLNNFVPIAKNMLLKRNSVHVEDKSLENVRLPRGAEKIALLTDPVQKIVKNIVHYCVRYHIEIIDYCDKIENEFSYLMLFQFLSSLYILCFQLFQLSVVESYYSFNTISMCFYLLLMMYQLFCYCWYGNEVMMTSSDMSIHLYNTDWLLTENSTRKSLLLMMMRAQRPIKFTAGKFALLSLATYLTIVRGSASYFMVLKQMNEL